jgi:nicotinamidase-related amidase
MMNANQDFRLSSNAVHLCIDMQRLFGPNGIWPTPWMETVLPRAAAIVKRFPERTIFTRFTRRSGRRICLECGAATTRNGGRRRENISTPDCWSSCRLFQIWHDRMGELEKATDLPARVKAEIEQFFLSATLFTDKQAKITGWSGPNAAHKLINASLTSRNT